VKSTTTAARGRTPLCPPAADHVCNDVCDWPVFTTEQRDRLRLLWRPGVVAIHRAARSTQREAA
jgi:hypothetical protein